MPHHTAPEALRITTSESIEVLDSDAERLALHVRYAPGSPPPPHSHPSSHERFTVLRGTLSARIGRSTVRYAAGESFEVAPGAVHAMAGAGSEPAEARWEISAPGRALDWFRTLDALQRRAETRGAGSPSLPVLAAALAEYADVLELRALPGPLNRALIAALAPLGRRQPCGRAILR